MLIRMSSRPKAAAAPSTSAWHWSTWARSVWKISARRPAARTLAAARSASLARSPIAERHIDTACRELTGDHQPDALPAGDQRDGVSELHTQMQPRKRDGTKKKLGDAG